MSTKAKASRKIRFSHIAKDGIAVIVTPNVIVAHNGKLLVTDVYVDVYEGNEKVAVSAIGALPLSSYPGLNYIDEETGLRWKYMTADHKYGYQLMSTGLKKNVTLSSTVTYDGKDYAFSFQVMNVNDGGQGDPGPAGKTGPYVPPPMWWDDYPSDPAYEFQAGGDSRLDIVLYGTAANGLPLPYRCIKKHSKSDSAKPTNTEYWAPADSGPYHMVATEILLAAYAYVKNLGAGAIQMFDSSNNIVFQAKDGNVTCNTGNFKNINISGNSTFKGFVLHEKFVVNSSNYNSVIFDVNRGTAETPIMQKEISLLKTGNWIYFSYIPSGSTPMLYLPAIRSNVTYGQAYLDYVRQFVGNEIIIYNNTNATIGIDTGENSLELAQGYAINLKMLFAPEIPSGENTYKERVKWQKTEKFSFSN